MRTLACAAALALTLGATAAQGALFEPAGNQVLFGMWFDPADRTFTFSLALSVC